MLRRNILGGNAAQSSMLSMVKLLSLYWRLFRCFSSDDTEGPRMRQKIKATTESGTRALGPGPHCNDCCEPGLSRSCVQDIGDVQGMFQCRCVVSLIPTNLSVLCTSVSSSSCRYFDRTDLNSAVATATFLVRIILVPDLSCFDVSLQVYDYICTLRDEVNIPLRTIDLR